MTEQNAALLCQAYGLPPPQAWQAVSERVWKLTTAQGRFAAKCYAPGQEARAHKEAALLQHLQGGSGYRVQTLWPTPEGAALWQERVLLTRWEDGQSKDHEQFSAQEWAALGAALAALHLRLDGLSLPGQENLQQRLQAIDLASLRRFFADCRGAQQAYAQAALAILDEYYPGALAAMPAPAAPIHNDYNQFNYLFEPERAPLILDWEASISAPREYEVVRCLNHLPLASPAMARCFVSAYLSTRPLQAGALAWAVDAACLQQGLKRWVVEGSLREPQRYAAHLAGATQMASMMTGARSTLIDFFASCLNEHHG